MNRPDIEGIKARGCGSHSCKVAEDKSGQRSNGPCRCAEDIPALLAYIAALEAALPKTADGEVIVPGMRVWAHVSTDEDSWYDPGLVRSIDLVGGKFELLVVCDDNWDLEDFAPCNVFAIHPITGERA